MGEGRGINNWQFRVGLSGSCTSASEDDLINHLAIAEMMKFRAVYSFGRAFIDDEVRFYGGDSIILTRLKVQVDLRLFIVNIVIALKCVLLFLFV